MKHARYVLLFLIMACIGHSITASAKIHNKSGDKKKGILLVTFGTSVPQAQTAFDHIEAAVKKTFPDLPLKWAYTSSMIRQKLAKEGKNVDSVEMALIRMKEEGFTHVAVQSLHTIRGEEFDDLVKTVKAMSMLPEGFEKIEIGSPLLSSQDDINKVSQALIDNIPTVRKKYDVVLIMGHGSRHTSNAIYTALMYQLQKKDPNIFVGTVEGTPDITDVVSYLNARKAKKVWLIPFMSVAGDHALNDMSGDGENSWKTVIGKEKITAVPVLKGTAEYSNMAAIWVDHLKDAVGRL